MSKPDTLTMDVVLPVTEEIVGEQPRFVYPSGDLGICTYVRNGEPDCIVGRVLHRLGWTVEELESYDGDGLGTTITHLMDHEVLEVEVEPAVYRFLDRLQSEQDCKTPWGKALEFAKAVA